MSPVLGISYQECMWQAALWFLQLQINIVIIGYDLASKAAVAGARQITLDGVYHSPLGSVAAVEGDKPGRPWYGSPEVVGQWIDCITADASELRDATLEVGDLVGSTVPE